MTIRDTFDFAAGAVAHALGESVVYTRTGSDPVTVEAVIGSGFERVQSGGVRISSSRPQIGVTLSDFTEFDMGPEDARGDSVSFLGETYEVVSLQTDIEGVSANLVLKKTS